MQRVRRLAAVAALALMVGLAAAGCAAAPGTAAYVGDFTLEDRQVEDAVKAIEADVARVPGQAVPDEAFGDLRQLIVRLTVFNEIARRYAAEKGHSVPASDYAGASPQLRLPATDPYLRLAVDAEVLLRVLREKTRPVAPTEEDLRDAFDRIIGAGVPGVTFDQIRPQLQQFEQFRLGVALRDELAAAARRYGVGVSPRYQPLEMPLTEVPNGQQGQVVLVALALGAMDSSAAVDR